MPEKITIDGEEKTRVVCKGTCGAVSLALSDPKVAVVVWNEEQRDRRRIMTDTELLKELREDDLRVERQRQRRKQG